MIKSQNPFAESVIDLTDKRILTISRSPKDFSPKLVDACITEAKKRGIENDVIKETKIEKKTNYLAIVRTNLSNGASIEDCETYLVNEGLDQETILSILDKAARTAPLQESKARARGKEADSKNNTGLGIFSTLLIIFFVVRMILRFFNN